MEIECILSDECWMGCRPNGTEIDIIFVTPFQSGIFGILKFAHFSHEL